MLNVVGLTKRFAKVVAVEDLSFKINPTEIYALIGPNGAGKTTTIKMIVGLYQKDSGEITLFDKDVTLDCASVKAAIGFIPDEPIFYPYLSGVEFLEFIRVLYGIPSKTYQKRLKTLLALYPIAGILNDLPAHYSRGNKQKLSIIAALLHNPALLVVDEPIVGLDPQSSQTTVTLFRDFAKKGGMILVSTHTLSFVEKVGSKVGILDRGKLICEGQVKEVVAQVKGAKSFTEAFVSLTSHD